MTLQKIDYESIYYYLTRYPDCCLVANGENTFRLLVPSLGRVFFADSEVFLKVVSHLKNYKLHAHHIDVDYNEDVGLYWWSKRLKN